MKKIHFQIAIFIFVLFLSVTITQAKTQGFVVQQRELLEQQLQEKYGYAGLAERMTILHDSSVRAEEGDALLKLYTATQWLDRGFIVDATQLLTTTAEPETFADLYRYYQAVLLVRSNQTKRAWPLLGQLELKYQNDPDLLYIKSMVLADQKQIADAIAVLDQIIDQNARDGRAYLQRGVYHLVAMAPEKSLKDFEKALQHLPKTEIVQRQQAYLQAGIICIHFSLNEKKGEKYLEQGIALDPNSELVGQVRQALR